jgi:hypothetical protein
MTAYEFSTLERHDRVRFLDGSLGTVITVWSDRVRVNWEDGAVTELYREDVLDGVDKIDPEVTKHDERARVREALEEAEEIYG